MTNDPGQHWEDRKKYNKKKKKKKKKTLCKKTYDNIGLNFS